LKLLRIVQREQCIGCFSCMMACARTWKNTIGVENAALRVRAYNGIEGAFSIRACYGCLDPDCARACPTSALSPRKGGGVSFDVTLCNHCGACITACVPSALQWDDDLKCPIVCHQCGVCVTFCPNSVLAMVDVGEE
jgi:Fe-S-cluster-containing dehydrogenase component